MLAWTKTTIAQHSFEIILEVESESLLNVTSLIETSNGDFVGKFSRVLYKDSLNTWDEYLIQISPIGDTATYLFKKEDTLLYFDKIIQVNDNPIQYFVQGMLFETDQTEWKHEWFSLLDESFNIIWEKIYKLSGRTFGFSTSDIIHLTDGSFLYARYQVTANICTFSI